MILIGLGANLEHPRYGPPRATLEAALRALEAAGVRIVRRSRWYRSAPVPPSDQPWFVNAVVQVETGLEPSELLGLLHRIEREFGRRRGQRNEARVVDLDLLAYAERVSAPGQAPELPHPRLHERDFVLRPLAEIAPDWRHPLSGLGVRQLLARLDAGQGVEPMD